MSYTYNDYKDLLFPSNLVGQPNGQKNIPNITLAQQNGKYIVTYSFLKTPSSILNTGYYIASDDEYSKFATTSYKLIIEQGIKNILAISNPNDYKMLFADVANIEFKNTDINGNGALDQNENVGVISIMQLKNEAFAQGVTANTYEHDKGSTWQQHGDIRINSEHTVWTSSTWKDLSPADETFKILIEETIHALGVDIIDNGFNSFLKNHKYTMTAYTSTRAPGMDHLLDEFDVSPYTLQLFDIAALQEIYGRNYNKLAGNTNWTVSAMNYSSDLDDAFLYTIWDGAGEDTIDVSELNAYSFSEGVEIDLRQGHFSSIGKDVYGLELPKDINATAGDPDPGNVAIAYFAVIENAKGTSRNDILIGNAWNNKLYGYDGNDELYGDGVVYDQDAGFRDHDSKRPGVAAAIDGSGQDELYGGNGNDYLYGGAGSDILDGGEGDDTLNGGSGHDRMIVSMGNDHYDGGEGIDTLDLSLFTSSIKIIGGQRFESAQGNGSYINIENFTFGSGDDSSSTYDAYSNRQHTDMGEGIDTLQINNGGALIDGDYIYSTNNSFSNVEKIKLNNSGRSSDIHILSLGNDFSGTTAGYAALDYSALSHSITSNSTSTMITGGGKTDAIAPNWNGGVIGTDHGDTFYGGFDFLMLGKGDDRVYQGGDIYYSGGNDILYYSPSAITLSPEIQASDVQITDIRLRFHGSYKVSMLGPLYYQYENKLIINIAGHGSITIPSYIKTYRIVGPDPEDELFSSRNIGHITLGNGSYFNRSTEDYDLVGTGTFSQTFGTQHADTIYMEAGQTFVAGRAGDDLIYGTSVAQTIEGDAGNDVIYAGAGNDLIIGDFGDDIIHAEGGNDILRGGFGNDELHGGDGDDDLRGHDGDDILFGGDGRDDLEGDVGSDELDGGAGNDVIDGGSDDDVLLGGEGNDNLYGGDGDDILTGGESNDSLDGGEGYDRAIFSGVYSNYLLTYTESYIKIVDYTGQNGTDYLYNIEEMVFTDRVVLTEVFMSTFFIGTSSNETITGSIYSDTINGYAGDDILIGAQGNDSIDGGEGIDTVSYENAAAGATVSLIIGSATNDGDGGTDTLMNIENIKGSNFNDILTGNTSNNALFGLNGDDILIAGAGNDTLYGDNGNDTIDGGAGNDVLIGGAGTDTLSYASATAAVTVNLATTTAQATGGSGSDTISLFENLTGSAYNDTLTGNTGANRIDGGNGNDTIDGGAGNDVLIGGAGTDTLSYAIATAAVTVNLTTTTAQATGGSGSDTISLFENILGSAYNDTLTGDAAANRIDGGAGNDTINGGAGNDVLIGGAGTDTLTYASATAAVTVSLANTAAQNTLGAGTDTISLFENLTGSAHNDILTGSTGANRIDGGAGNDTIDGGAGNDVLIGGAGTDTLSYASATAAVTVNLSTSTAQATGGSGSDTISLFENLTGSGFNDTLRGTTGVNVMNGGNGNDTLYGNSGNDTLYGGAGNDTLYGDAGNDLLLGEAGTDILYGGAGADTFKFRTGGGIDTIKDFKLSELDKLDIRDLLSGYTTSKAITDFIQITTSGTNSIVKIDANGTTGGVAWTQIATIEGVTGLTDELALKNSGAIIV